MTDMQKIDFHYNVPDRLRELDSLLWRFDDLAFLPHVRAASPLAGETPIRLSSRLEELEGSRSRFRAYKAAGVELAAYDRRS